MNSLSLRSFTCMLFVFALSTVGLAASDRDRTQVGHNINIGADDDVTDATCFGCSIYIRGHVSGDATTFGGSIVVEDGGSVDHDATVFGGNIRLDREVAVKGDVTIFGGRLHRDPAAKVGGDVTDFGGGFWMVLIFVGPLLILGLLIAAIVWLVRRLLRPAAVAA